MSVKFTISLIISIHKHFHIRDFLSSKSFASSMQYAAYLAKRPWKLGYGAYIVRNWGNDTVFSIDLGFPLNVSF